MQDNNKYWEKSKSINAIQLYLGIWDVGMPVIIIDDDEISNE